eukprot:m.10966 g.10966  ORF g.10966 m.10966 type:complete len:213 (-) comp6777_c0_seq1:159-797(-)
MGAKLYYFEGRRGDAEAIRMMFKEGGIDFDDVGVSEDQFQEMDAAGDLLFGQLPMVDFDGFKIVEQPAILEHIAQLTDEKGGKNKYLGENENERSTARSLCSAARQIRRELLHMLQVGSVEAKKDFKDRVIPFWFTSIDALAVSSGDEDQGLGDGVHFTFGDLAIFEVLNAISYALNVGVLRKYPNLKEWHDKAMRRSALEKHIASRADAEW